VSETLFEIKDSAMAKLFKKLKPSFWHKSYIKRVKTLHILLKTRGNNLLGRPYEIIYTNFREYIQENILMAILIIS
jgi:hypothetical protein